MFYKYEIKNHKGINTLFLYMSMSEEESLEFADSNNLTIEDRIKRFIKNNNINYEAGPVYLVINGIVVKSIDIKEKDVDIEVIDVDNSYSNNKFIVRIKNDTETTSMVLRDYLLGVIITNIPNEVNIEVLKAVSILYRTYAYKQMGKIGYIKSDDYFAKFRNISYYKLLWFNEFEIVSNKILKAIDETDCMFITYNNIFIKPYIHNTNNGSTDTLKGVNYLVSVPSLWDLTSPKYLSINKYTLDTISKKLGVDKDNLFNIKIIELTDGSCIKKIKVGYSIFDGDDFVEKIGLPSKDLTILIDDKYITFVNRGYGDNLGISISGSNSLAEDGCTYLQLINYYFPKCNIKKYT